MKRPYEPLVQRCALEEDEFSDIWPGIFSFLIVKGYACGTLFLVSSVSRSLRDMVTRFTVASYAKTPEATLLALCDYRPHSFYRLLHTVRQPCTEEVTSIILDHVLRSVVAHWMENAVYIITNPVEAIILYGKTTENLILYARHKYLKEKYTVNEAAHYAIDLTRNALVGLEPCISGSKLYGPLKVKFRMLDAAGDFLEPKDLSVIESFRLGLVYGACFYLTGSEGMGKPCFGGFVFDPYSDPPPVISS